MSRWHRERACARCGETKPHADFPPDQRKRDGIKYVCRDCERESQRQWRGKNAEHLRAKARERYRQNREAISARNGRYKTANRIKARAHSAIEYALESGRLTRPDSCEQCGGSGTIHAHHDDYERKLDVRWLCARCHKEFHVAVA
jgi:ribosomal protein S27AE